MPILSSLALTASLLCLVPQEEPTVAAEYMAKAVLAAGKGKFAAADRFYQRILKEAPDAPEAKLARERLQPNALLNTSTIADHGPPENRVDVFVMAEGYLRKDLHTFRTQAEGTARLFFQVPVFHRYEEYFNFHAMHIASKEDGVDKGEKKYDTALGGWQTEYSQGQVSVNHGDVFEYLNKDPRNDSLAVVLVRRGTLGTGGGGVAVCGGGASNTVVHEWGHAFGGLTDEYTSDVGYGERSVRGINISDSDDPDLAPWKHWLDAKVKGVGLFAGGAGRSRGAWRPTGRPCSMASGTTFCVVCREALVAGIYGMVRPLDRATPASGLIDMGTEEERSFEVMPMKVATAPLLEVSFAIEPGPAITGGTIDEATASLAGDQEEERPGRGNRGRRGRSRRPRWGMEPAPPLTGTPLKAKRTRDRDKREAYTVTVSAEDLGPGLHRLRARIVDPTDMVLREDWRACLTDEVEWLIRVR